MKKLVTILTAAFLGLNAGAQVFSGDLPGIDSIWVNYENAPMIEDLYNDGDSILHITGVFRKVNNIDANKICSWDGSEIIFYGSDTGIDGYPKCVQMYNDTLYIGGQFYNYSDPSRNYLTIWNGESWQGSTAGQPRGPIWDMCIYNGKLCIAGNFTYIGEQNYGKIALYNGAEWENIGDLGAIAFAVESFNGDLLYAGGHYSYGIKKYLGGTDWEAFEDRPNDYLYALKADTFNTFLYAGGMFTRMGNLRSRGIAMWDGFKWNSMHYEYGSTVGQKAIAIYRGDVYTGSNFTYDEATDTYNYFIARWNGESWDSIGGNFDDTMGAIEVFQNEIYIGGGFRTYNGGQRNKGLVKLTMPDNGCNYIKPRINTFADTVYLGSGASTSSATAEMHFFNNNPYVDTWTWDFGDGGTADIKDPVHTYTDSGTYVVKITVTHEGCSKSYEKTIRIEADTTSSVASYANIDFQIFPNPSSGNFTVKMDTHRSLSISVSEPRLLSAVEVSRTAETTLNSTIELRIHGTNGHLTDIIPVTSDETIINTQNWKPGTYICNLFIDGKLIRTEKLILK